jgi:hypothetical protein
MNVGEINRNSYTGPTSDIASFTGEFKTPTSAKNDVEVGGPYEGGALRPGGKPNLYSREYIGLIFNYIGIGLLYGGLPALKSAVFTNYLGMESYQAMAASTLLLLPWSLKTIIGIVTDSFPILNYRRRYYIIGGWTLCFLILAITAIAMPIGDPYRVTGTQEILNPDAPSSGSKYIIMLTIATFAYVVSDVATDGVVVELAQAEPLKERGNTQATVYMWRMMMYGVSRLTVAFTMNGYDYGGDFSWALSLNTFLGIYCIIAFIPAVGVTFFLKETKVSDITDDIETAETFNKELTFGGRLREMWTITHRRCIWQVILFNFLNTFFIAMYAPSGIYVGYEWAKITPLTENIASFMTMMLFSFGMWYIKGYCLNLNWRYLIIIATVSMTVLDSISMFCTIFDVIRNKYFYLGPTVVEGIPSGIQFIVSGFVTVEVAEPGYEAATFGLLATVGNLSIPFAGSVSNLVGSMFNAYKEAFISDTSYDRWQVAGQYFYVYSCWLFSLVWLFLLPKDKVAAQKLKNHGGSNPAIGGSLVVFFALCLCYTTTTNFLSIFESTACLQIAGGNGC